MAMMLERHEFEIARIYVPVKRAKDLDRARVETLAEDILEHGQTTPISVRLDRRADGTERYVLIEGLHRLEALKALGETTVTGFVVQPRIR
ncbi:MAG TPA: ParB N-terminal domain-containing protein [Thermohalobaculum sp.]|nr:ParB N-terminal domain-containing protein [Thermohalobaculum sp.]